MKTPLSSSDVNNAILIWLLLYRTTEFIILHFNMNYVGTEIGPPGANVVLKSRLNILGDFAMVQ